MSVQWPMTGKAYLRNVSSGASILMC
jgi:hypothetical protein